MKYFLLTATATWLSGCVFLPESPTAIVRRAEACGLGSASAASQVAMQDWFARHRDCAVAVDDLCRSVRETATAQWTDSTEGRVCLAARSVGQWIRRPSGEAR